MKTAEEIICNPPTIEAGAPFVCLDEAALNQILHDALLHAAEIARQLNDGHEWPVTRAILAEAKPLLIT